MYSVRDVAKFRTPLGQSLFEFTHFVFGLVNPSLQLTSGLRVGTQNAIFAVSEADIAVLRKPRSSSPLGRRHRKPWPASPATHALGPVASECRPEGLAFPLPTAAGTIPP